MDNPKVDVEIVNSAINKVLTIWQKINQVQRPIKKELYLDMIGQIANLFSIGSFYFFILNFDTLRIEMLNDGFYSVLGYKPKRFAIQDLMKKMHPDDMAKMSEKENLISNFFLAEISGNDMPFYKIVYLIRVKHANGAYRTILHQSRIIAITDKGKIQESLCIHTDVTHLNIPIDHKVSFIGDKRPSYYAEEGSAAVKKIKENNNIKYSTREKEIIVKLSQGKDFNGIAAELCISPHTVNTHKKNILAKSNCKNAVELIAHCIRSGVI